MLSFQYNTIKFYENSPIKNKGSPLLAQNEVRDDIFSGSLAVFQSERVASAGGRKGDLGGGIPPALQIHSTSLRTGFGRNPFEFFRTHTASWEMSLLARPLRGLASRF